MGRKRGKRSKRKTLSFQQRELYIDLMKECMDFEVEHTEGVELSISLRERLESCKVRLRRKIICYVGPYGSPLYVACKTSNFRIAKYLITHGHANVNAIGPVHPRSCYAERYETPLHRVTIMRELPFVKLLVSSGAYVNEVSDEGMTPLQITCLNNDGTEIMSYLLENGADPNVRYSKKAQKFSSILEVHNHNTCLMECVSKPNSSEKCALLLKHGAKINDKNNRGNTALHIAAMTSDLKTIVLLLNHGADPYLKNRSNDNALRTCSIHNNKSAMQCLIKNVSYSREERAEALELMDAYNTFSERVTYLHNFWKQALIIHVRNKLDGRNTPVYVDILAETIFSTDNKFLTKEEVELIKPPFDTQKSKNLSTIERILGLSHHFTLERVAIEAEWNFVYQDCINLWTKTLEDLVAQNYNISYTCAAFLNSFKRFVDTLHSRLTMRPETRFAAISSIFKSAVLLLATSSSTLPPERRYRKIDPVYLERFFESMLNLLTILLNIVPPEEEKSKLYHLVRLMVKFDLRSACKNNSALHYIIKQEAGYKVSSENLPFILRRITLLLECGANINARNKRKMTPLHLASKVPSTTIEPIVTLLLDHGAYLFTPNDKGETPADLFKEVLMTKPDFKNYTLNLEILAAKAIVKYRINTTKLPAACRNIIEWHR